MLSLAVFSFEDPAIAFHLEKDEAGLGVTTLRSRELLLISEHDLPRFQYALDSSIFQSTRQFVGYVHPDPPCEFAVSVVSASAHALRRCHK